MHRTAFSYYGGKGMIVNRYPAPKHKTIIEPFAGGAAYSLKYYKHDVVLNDLNQKTYGVWKFITNLVNYKFIKKIPVEVKKGDTIDNITKGKGFPSGLIYLLRSACNVGTFGAKNCNQITKIGAEKWKHNTIDKLKFWMPKLCHWKITNKDYISMENVEATWFVDPPYNNDSGKIYKTNIVNYSELSKWCLSRKGFIVVCEDYGANWLPFIKTKKAPGLQSKHRSTKRIEGVYVNYNGG